MTCLPVNVIDQSAIQLFQTLKDIWLSAVKQETICAPLTSGKQFPRKSKMLVEWEDRETDEGW